VKLSAPLVHSVFRLAGLRGLAAFCADHVFSSLLSWRNSTPCLISRNIKKKVIIIPFTQPGLLATMLQVSFISSAIRFRFCVLHIHTACSYYPCSHPSLLHPAHFILSPYLSHCMLTYDYRSCLLFHCMLVSWDMCSLPY